MEEKKRYHIRVKPILCLTAEEALASGVSVNEETVEMVVLEPNPVAAPGYAVLRTEPVEVIAALTPSQRGERIFQSRHDAMRYLQSQDPGMFRLYGVKETRPLERDEIAALGDTTPLDTVLRQLQEFEDQDRKKDRD